MWNGYLNWDGCEIVNDEQTFSYMRTCPPQGRTINLACQPALGDWPCNPGPYTDPGTDSAWFYDPLLPETLDGYGVWVKQIDGFDPTGVRTVTQSDIFGGIAGPYRKQGRTVTITAEVLGKTCHAATLLLQALTRAITDTPCGGAQVTMLECCAEDTTRVGDWERQMFGARTIEGPKILRRIPSCSCGPGCGGSSSIEVQWSFFVPTPHIYGCEPIGGIPVTFDPESLKCNIEWVTDCTPAPDPILFDPECFPSLAPVLPTPTNLSCFCDPIVSVQACFALENPFQFREGDFYFNLYGGNSEMVNWKIEAFHNPLRLPCPCDDTTAPYWENAEPAFSLTIPHLPANSRVTLDGRTREALVTFPGGQSEPAWRYISATDGGAFSWPEIGACESMCVVVTADGSVTDTDTAIIQVAVYPRTESSL